MLWCFLLSPVRSTTEQQGRPGLADFLQICSVLAGGWLFVGSVFLEAWISKQVAMLRPRYQQVSLDNTLLLLLRLPLFAQGVSVRLVVMP